MAVSRRRLILALSRSPGIGGRTIARILTRNDLTRIKPDKFLTLSEETLVEEYRLPARTAGKWTEAKKALIEDAAKVEDRLDRLGVSLITAADAFYPPQVEQFDPDPPGVLFSYGNARILEAKSFAVMSSRKSPTEALEAIEGMAEEGVLGGETLITGHDTPEYQRSAIVPLRWGAPRILVLDRGLFAALGEELAEEPFRAARLWRYRFDPQTDLAISSLHPDQDFAAQSNKARDWLIACLASRIDFVRIAKGGNMEKLAKRALQVGRPVRVSAHWTDAAEFEKLGAKVLSSS